METKYYVDLNGNYLGGFSEGNPAIPESAIEVPSAPQSAADKWVDDAWEHHALVPASVTRRQALQALILASKYDLVQPAIDAIPDPVQRQLMQIEWDDSQDFERQRPALIQMAYAIGLTDQELDNLFIQAASL